MRDIDNGWITSGVNDAAGYVPSNSNTNTVANKITEALRLGNASINRGMWWVISTYELDV